MFQIIHILTNFFAKILRLFVDTTVLESWKPIHLCWWFEKHNKPIPKYFIGAAGGWQTPSVTTTSATSTGISTIYCVGSNTDPHPEDRPVSARGFVWIQGTGTPTTSDNVVTVGTVGDGSFNATISDLNFNTLYSIRAYATNFAGTAYGDTITETTDSGDDLTKDLSDTITFSDNTTRERGLTKSLSDSLMFSDEFNRESIFERIIDDSINFSDVFNRESEYFRTQNDSLTFSDNTLRETSLVKQLSDMITFSDEWSSRKRPPIGLKKNESDMRKKNIVSDITIKKLDLFIGKEMKESDIKIQIKQCDISNETLNANTQKTQKESMGVSLSMVNTSLKITELEIT